MTTPTPRWVEEYVVVWNGCRPAPVAPPPPEDAPRRRSGRTREEIAAARAAGRRHRALRNRTRKAVTRRKPEIWALLREPRTAREVAAQLQLPLRPVAVLLSKAARTGSLVSPGYSGQGPGRAGRAGRYVQAPTFATWTSFPPVRRYGAAA